MRNRSAHLQKEVSLAETLNRVLNKGAVLAGDIIISVADIDLVYIGVNLMVSSVETMKGRQQRPGQGESKFVEDNHDMV
ncbi:MAG: gas vesicle protein [Ignavibacteria bacterium]|nr:gas vesicle protein [Ignavibacteria bacterium]